MIWGIKKNRIITFIVVGLCALFIVYAFFGQEYLYAKKYANTLFDVDVPNKTKVIEQNFDYGTFYGGGPWGSGGYPTLVAYQILSTELSEREIFNYYSIKDFEIYFEGMEVVKKNHKNQFWYEGIIKEDVLNTEKNTEKPIKVIIQYRKEFSYPLFIDFN